MTPKASCIIVSKAESYWERYDENVELKANGSDSDTVEYLANVVN